MGFFDTIKKVIQDLNSTQQGAVLPDVVEIDWTSPNYRDSSDYPRRDPNRKLTKRMEISYNRLIALFEPVQTIEEGIKKFHLTFYNIHPEHAKNFFNHPHVVRALNLKPVLESNIQSEAVNWWDVKSEDKSSIPWSSDTSSIPWSSIPVSESVDICGDPSCSTGVNAFDFRCFTCRKRYCDTHKGTGIDCKSCESLS